MKKIPSFIDEVNMVLKKYRFGAFAIQEKFSGIIYSVIDLSECEVCPKQISFNLITELLSEKGTGFIEKSVILPRALASRPEFDQIRQSLIKKRVEFYESFEEALGAINRKRICALLQQETSYDGNLKSRIADSVIFARIKLNKLRAFLSFP